jgi:hypothetical protein
MTTATPASTHVLEPLRSNLDYLVGILPPDVLAGAAEAAYTRGEVPRPHQREARRMVGAMAWRTLHEIGDLFFRRDGDPKGAMVEAYTLAAGHKAHQPALNSADESLSRAQYMCAAIIMLNTALEAGRLPDGVPADTADNAVAHFASRLNDIITELQSMLPAEED